MKFIRKLILFIIVLVLICCGIVYANGKKMYDEKISETSIEEKVASIKSSDDFVSIRKSS